MKFGSTLRKSVYAPWKDQYVDYDKLKNLLREHDDDKPWTSDDVTQFTEELANVQLEKVYNFKRDVQEKLKERTTACEKKLEPLAIGIKAEEAKDSGETPSSSKDNKSGVPPAERKKLLQDVLKELDGITKEVKELEKYGRINYTAVIKATKKHDKLRGRSYRLRPFINARLTEKPIYTEDQSPLLYRLSAMYSFVRQSLDGKPQEALSFADNATSTEEFTSYKCMAYFLTLQSSTNSAQSGSTRRTCSKSKPSSSAVSRSSCTTRRPPRSPKAPSVIPLSLPYTLTTRTSRCTRTRSTMSQMLRPFVLGGTASLPKNPPSFLKRRI